MANKEKTKAPAPKKQRGPTWDGYYPRLTKTKREKEIQEQRKCKQRERAKREW